MERRAFRTAVRNSLAGRTNLELADALFAPFAGREGARPESVERLVGALPVHHVVLETPQGVRGDRVPSAQGVAHLAA